MLIGFLDPMAVCFHQCVPLVLIEVRLVGPERVMFLLEPQNTQEGCLPRQRKMLLAAVNREVTLCWWLRVTRRLGFFLFTLLYYLCRFSVHE